MSNIEIQRKLRVWATISEAYSAATDNLPTLARMVWLWFVVMTPILLVFHWTAWRFKDDDRSGESVDFAALGIAITEIALPLLFVSSIAVAWHRFILEGDRPSARGYFRLDAVVWKYALVASLMVLALLFAIVPMAVFDVLEQSESMALDQEGLAYGLIVGGILLAWIIILLVVCRLSVIFPAIALARREIGLAAVWRTTRGNTWRLLLGSFVCFLPVFGAESVSLGILPSETQVQSAISHTLADLIGALFAVIQVGFLSLAYRSLFGPDEQSG